MQDFSLKYLLYPGTFLLNSKIYYYAGTVIYPETAPNFLVYSISLSSDNIELVEERFKFPIALNNPVSTNNSKYGFICGGLDYSSKPNIHCYKFTEKKGFCEIKNKNLEILENYPPRYTNNCIVMIAFPKLAVMKNNEEGWALFNLFQNNRRKTEVKLINSRENSVEIPPLFKAGIVTTAKIKTRMMTQPRSQFGSSLGSNASNMKNLSSYTLVEMGDNEEKINNSPNAAQRKNDFEYDENSQNEFSDKLIVSGELLVSIIVSTQNDDLLSISHKNAIKLLCIVSTTINQKKLSALSVNHLSNDFGFKQEITIIEMIKALNSVLSHTKYACKTVLEFVKFIYKIIERPKIPASKIKEFIDMLSIPKRINSFTKDETILIITRTVKALLIQEKGL